MSENEAASATSWGKSEARLLAKGKRGGQGEGVECLLLLFAVMNYSSYLLFSAFKNFRFNENTLFTY